MHGRTVSYLLAAFLWVVCAAEMCLVAWKGYQGGLSDVPILGPLFVDRQSGSVVAPMLVLTVFAWVLLEILFHAIQVFRERSGVLQIQEWSGQELQNPPSGSRVNSRIRLVADNINKAPEQLHDALPAAAALDADRLESTYALTKAFVWILPVLGFIGTAWAMSHAIGGFGQALQETSDIRVLTDRLSQLVIPSLGGAFAVTIVALGASIVGHFCVSAVQSWDAAELQALDRVCLTLLAGIPRPVAPGLSSEVVKALAGHLEKITGQLRELNRKLDLSKPATELSNAAQLLSASAREMEQTGKVLQASATLPYNITITRGSVGAK